jgi:ABC-2 type transport system ATP-binding protein
MPLALDIQNLRKTYSGGFEALKGINLQIEEGDFFALLGPNGAGKSTTIGVICSLVEKTSGSVAVFGNDLDQQKSQAKRHIGLVPQEINFNVFEPVYQVLVNQAGYYGMSRAKALKKSEELLHVLDLHEKRNTAGRMLSGGMKRRLMIARALMHQPKLLILDEPTAGVDIEIRRSMWQFLTEQNEQGTTIILTTHYLEEAESLCRNIAIINSGVIAENTDMRSLLSTLALETFILDLRVPLPALPEVPAPFAGRLLNENTIEIDVPKEQGINPIFRWLETHNIKVMSLRNKANRLEELFLNMVENNT